MAEFRVSRYVAQDGQLPMICMRCGAPAIAYRKKGMTYRPGWVLLLILLGLLPFLIVALITEKRCRLMAPLCEQHEGHWRVRRLWLWGIFLSAVVIGVGGLVTRNDSIMGMACFASAIIGLGWLITAAVLHETSIHSTEITDAGMTLVGVSQRFLDALYSQPRTNPSGRLEEQEYFRPGGRGERPPGPGDQYYNPR